MKQDNAQSSHLILGYGEVGAALHGIFPEADVFDTSPRFVHTELKNFYDVLHICFPFTPNIDFIGIVESYKEKFSPKLVVIHSSVPIGTSLKLNAVHSPIRGVHPNLEKGIRTFVKYFGGAGAFEAAQLFAEKGIKVQVVTDSRTTEAAKLWDTTQYGVMILLEKEIHAYCEKNGLDFETIYRSFNETYNMGYIELGMPQVVRPHLMHKPGKIGGHCVVPNAHLLDTPTAKRIIDENTQL